MQLKEPPFASGTFNSPPEPLILHKTVPAEIPAIFLAGWIYECCWQKNSNNEREKIGKYMTISRLLLKACEDTEIIRKIQECQS